jgi:ribosomal protein S27AE
MKACKKCGVEKAATDFYAERAVCKTCVAVRRAQKYWADPDAARAYKRRYQNGAEYSRSWREKNPGRQQAYYQTWAERNRQKQRAHSAVKIAIRKGILLKEDCEKCGATSRIHAHHDNYSEPLVVRWLCLPCHKEHHRLNPQLEK